MTDGDAVAGIVYVTDAQAAGAKVDTVEIPTAQNVVAKYPIAVLKATTSSDLAERLHGVRARPGGPGRPEGRRLPARRLIETA